jgi:hypothetical protein
MPADKKRVPAVRLPKSIERELQQIALDEDSTFHALVHPATQSELGRRAPGPARARSRRPTCGHGSTSLGKDPCAGCIEPRPDCRTPLVAALPMG